MVDDPSERWTRFWRALQPPLSWALGASILVFETLTGARFHPELIVVGAGLVGLPLVWPGKRSD